MAMNSNVKYPKTRDDSKVRIIDSFAFEPHWAKKAAMNPVEVDLAFESGYISGSCYFKMSRPILFLERLSGRLPIEIRSGWMRYSYKSAPFFYSVGVSISYVVLTTHYRETLQKTWSKLYSSDSPEFTFEAIMFSCLVLMQIPLFFVIICSLFVEAPAIVRCYNMTAVVEKKLTAVFPTCAFTARARTIVTTLLVLYFVVTMIVGSLLLSSRFDEAPWFTIFTFVYNFILSHSSCITWCFNFFFVWCLAGRLRKHMVTFLQVGENRVSKIKSCQKIWMALWKLSQKYADASAITLLIVLIMNGIIFVIATYGMIASIRAGSMVDILTISPYLGIALLNVVSVLEMAHLARNNLGEKFIGTLMEMDKDTWDRESVEEVERFMSMINYTENARITLKGFVTVDRALLVSFLSYSITYLIVLIQLQGNVNAPPSDEQMSSKNISET